MKKCDKNLDELKNRMEEKIRQITKGISGIKKKLKKGK